MTTPTICATCDDTGHVCENHPDRPWGGISAVDTACCCGAGEPCPACCHRVQADGSTRIGDAFMPRRQRDVEDRRP